MRGLPLLLALAGVAQGRINSTGALETFWISDCNLCTNGQRDSIFCTSAGSDANWVANATTRFTVGMKKQAPPGGLGPGDGNKYCWSGTFGSMLNNKGGPYDLLGSSNVSASLDCDTNNLYYRQCYSASLLALLCPFFCFSAALLGPSTPFHAPTRPLLAQSPCSSPSSSSPLLPCALWGGARACAFAAAAAGA